MSGFPPKSQCHCEGAISMKLLVFGESGQVARAVEKIAALTDTDVEFYGRSKFDLGSERADALIERVRPSAVINASAHTAVDRAENESDFAKRLNRDAPAEMARGCRDLGIPFVHILTDYVFDGAKPSPYVETDDVHPLGVYGRSKAEGEKEIESIGGLWSTSRTAWVLASEGANFFNTMKLVWGRA